MGRDALEGLCVSPKPAANRKINKQIISHPVMFRIVNRDFFVAGCHHRCINSEGSFRCQCRDGFEVDPAAADESQQCVDRDECGGGGDRVGNARVIDLRTLNSDSDSKPSSDDSDSSHDS